MIVKRYSPVRIQNPTSYQHVVRVKPGQRINLSLSNDMCSDLDVAVVSNYLKIESCEVSDTRKVYTLSHHSDVYQWSEYSQFFLGEIWVDYEKSISKLGVFLESVNEKKKKFVTLVNPDSSDLRVKPENIIEVILYDPQFSYQDEWSCQWQSDIPNIILEQIGSDHLCLQSWNNYGVIEDDPSYPYAKIPRFETVDRNWSRQHHFWFRFGSHVQALNELVQKYRGDVVYAGKFLFEGRSNRFIVGSKNTKYNFDLYLDCRKPNAFAFIDTASLKTKDECSPYAHCSTVKKSKKKKQKDTGPVVRHVDVIVASQSFDSCRVAEPVKSVQQFDDDPYGFEGECVPFRHHNHYPITRYV